MVRTSLSQCPCHTDLFPCTALIFDPERFLDARVRTYLTHDPYIFCPFNAGPRICLGQQFAYHEASFFLVRLLQRFTDFSLASEVNTAPPTAWAHTTGRRATERVHPMSHLTLYVKVCMGSESLGLSLSITDITIHVTVFRAVSGLQ